MKASTLIEILLDEIANTGDKEVVIGNFEGSFEEDIVMVDTVLGKIIIAFKVEGSK